jgi:hypothetical protein
MYFEPRYSLSGPIPRPVDCSISDLDLWLKEQSLSRPGDFWVSGQVTKSDQNRNVTRIFQAGVLFRIC